MFKKSKPHIKADPPENQKPAAPQPREYRRGTGFRLGFIAILFMAGLILAFRIVNGQRSQAALELARSTEADAAAPPIVEVVAVKPLAATRTITLPGETAAWYDSKIYARVNGYVAKWFVDIGDHAANGQTLARIETPELDAELTAGRAKLRAAQAQVDVKKADADFGKSTFERWRDSPSGVVSQQERESKKAAYVVANAQLVAAKAQVALDQANVDRLTALTQFKEVKAPFAGTITQRNIDIGNLVAAGSSSNTAALYRLSLDEPMRVFVDAPQSVSADLLKGDVTADVTTSDFKDRHFAGKVTRTSKSINQQARTLRVEVDIPNPDQTLVPGMYVQVALSLKNAHGGVEVPAAALVFRPGPQVAVVDDDAVITFRDVTIGDDDGATVQIATGLQDGDKVGLNVSSQVLSGEKVDVRDLDNKAARKVAGR